MAEKDDDESGLSERVVKEAVGKGMETSMREPIVEAVEEADEGDGRKRRIPITGAIMGLGAAVGYLVGSRRKGAETEDESVEELLEDEPAEEAETEDVEEAEEAKEAEEAEEAETGGSRLRKVLALVGIAGAIALLRRRLSSTEEEEEWEPIEEFEPAVDLDEGEEESEPDEGITAEEDDEE